MKFSLDLLFLKDLNSLNFFEVREFRDAGSLKFICEFELQTAKSDHSNYAKQVRLGVWAILPENMCAWDLKFRPKTVGNWKNRLMHCMWSRGDLLRQKADCLLGALQRSSREELTCLGHRILSLLLFVCVQISWVRKTSLFWIKLFDEQFHWSWLETMQLRKELAERAFPSATSQRRLKVILFVIVIEFEELGIEFSEYSN